MNADTLTDICVESCEESYEYCEVMQESGENVGRATIRVRSYEVIEDHIRLIVEKKIIDTAGLGLSVKNRAYFDRDVTFEEFDETSMTVIAYPSKDLLKVVKDGTPEILLITDLKWLMKRTCEFYRSFGKLISLPKTTPHFESSEYRFPKNSKPSDEQKSAVDTVLNSKLSYVWGAPGTGKTQFVLATAILAYMRRGERVAILAPTNNSVEQVLRGVLNIIKDEDPEGNIVNIDRDILRLGMATSEFLREFPKICENRNIDRLVESKKTVSKS